MNDVLGRYRFNCTKCGIVQIESVAKKDLEEWKDSNKYCKNCAELEREPVKSEVDSLSSRIVGLEIEYTIMQKRIESQNELMNVLIQKSIEREKEIERLKAGKFTPEELQNLCHNLKEEDEQAFKQGCIDYQKKLFGEKK